MHHSRRDAPEECQGRETEQVASVSVNARNYRVTVQSASRQAGGGRSDSDSDGDPGPAHVSYSEPGPGPGSGESCNGCNIACNDHVI